jgi:rhodanese-related sulfurtransferase
MDKGALSEMTVEQVAKRLGQKNFFVIDNNNRGRWAAGHVPGAKNLNAGEFTQADLPSDKSATLVFYCAGPS